MSNNNIKGETKYYPDLINNGKVRKAKHLYKNDYLERC